jgi:hypothetical protein
LALLDLGLEGSPIGEAVVSRYGQQSGCKLGLRVGTPEIP